MEASVTQRNRFLRQDLIRVGQTDRDMIQSLQPRKNKGNNGRPTENQSFLMPQRIVLDDGCVISAMVSIDRPTTKSRTKAVLFVHGFAAEKTENGLFSEVAVMLSKKGFGILAYDWRGLGESEGDFASSRLDLHADDLRQIISWYCKEINIRASELCVVGFSLGAAIAASVVLSGQEVGSLAFLSPATQPSRSMWPRYQHKEIWQQITERGYYLKPHTKVKLGKNILQSIEKTDLGCAAIKLGVPILVCHGTADERIPISFSRELRACADRDGLDDVHFLEFPGASHSFRPEAHRPRLFESLVSWVEGLPRHVSSSHPPSSRGLQSSV